MMRRIVPILVPLLVSGAAHPDAAPEPRHADDEKMVRNECLYFDHANKSADLRLFVALPHSFRRTSRAQTQSTDFVTLFSLWCPMGAGGRSGCFGATADLGARGKSILSMSPMEKDFNATAFRVVERNGKIFKLESSVAGRMYWFGEKAKRRQTITVDFEKQRVTFSSHTYQSYQTEDEQGEADCKAQWLQERSDGQWEHLIRPADVKR